MKNDSLKKYRSSQEIDNRIPLYLNNVHAGFPSAAEDYVDTELDLNQFLIKNPSATFMVRAKGDSMKDAGIVEGDILIVDRSIDAEHGKIIIACVDNQLTVKKLYNKNGRVILMPANKEYKPIEMKSGNELIAWGVVTGIVRKLR